MSLVQEIIPSSLDEQIDIHSASAYETYSFLATLPFQINLINPILISNYRYYIFLRLLRKSKNITPIIRETIYSTIFDKNALSHFCISLGGTILNHSIYSYQAYLEKTMIREIVQKTKKENGFRKALKKQAINDDSFIYLNPFSLEKSAFKPKTIVNIQNHNFGTKLYVSLKKQMETILQLSNQKRSLFLNEFLRDRVITEKDCEKEQLANVLVGQKGVYAKKDIKKNTVLGFYSGIYVKNEVEYQFLCQKYTREALALYTFGFYGQSYPKIISYQCGNKLCLVNACTTYEKPLEETVKEYCLRHNVAGIYAKSGENPDKEYLKKLDAHDLVVYVTTRDIKKGEQLFIDYGKSYWSNRIGNVIKETDQEILAAITKYRGQLLIKKLLPTIR